MFCFRCLHDLPDAPGHTFATCALHGASDVLPAAVVGDYRITSIREELDTRLVFGGHELRTGRPVVLSLLDVTCDTAEQATAIRDRFQPFFDLGAPNVDEILAVEIVDHRVFVMSPHRDGHRLSAEHPASDDPVHARDPHRLVRIFDGILAGLATLHAHGIVHGALQPSTVWIEPTRDRGDIAILLDCEATLLFREHRQHLVPPPPIWPTLSPDQIAGRPLTPASDVYAFGALAYWLFAGAPPFAGTSFELAANIMVQPLAPLYVARVDLPSSLVEVIHACLDRDPTRRPADAFELAARFDAIALVPDGPLGDRSLAYGGHRPRPGDPPPTTPHVDPLTLAPRERDLLAAVLADPGDPTCRHVYADWLDEQGHATRAAFLRLDADDTTHELALRGFATPEHLAWRAAVSRAPILCGDASGRCTRRWNTAGSAPLPVDTASRRCSTCFQNVHYVFTPEQALARSRAGDAIAVDASLPLARARAAYIDRSWQRPLPPEYLSPPPRAPEDRPPLWQRVRRWLRR